MPAPIPSPAHTMPRTPSLLPPSRTPLAASLIATALLLGTTLPAQAARTDRDQPMQIEADAMRHDQARQTTIFSGNVVLTKGSIILRGAQLQVREDAQGNHHGSITAAQGQRAYFRQSRDTAPGTPPEYVEGEAEAIEYNGQSEDIRLLRRSQLRRYSGGQLRDDISGNIITYNNLTDIFSVDSAQRSNPADANTPAPAAPTGRVRAVLAPRRSTSTDTPAPTQPAPQPTTPQP